jgi:hypothetical protein
MDKIKEDNPEVKMGGYWSPANCQARHKVSLVILFILV